MQIQRNVWMNANISATCQCDGKHRSCKWIFYFHRKWHFLLYVSIYICIVSFRLLSFFSAGYWQEIHVNKRIKIAPLKNLKLGQIFSGFWAKNRSFWAINVDHLILFRLMILIFFFFIIKWSEWQWNQFKTYLGVDAQIINKNK